MDPYYQNSMMYYGTDMYGYGLAYGGYQAAYYPTSGELPNIKNFHSHRFLFFHRILQWMARTISSDVYSQGEG
jgi:hypothetical protein